MNITYLVDSAMAALQLKPPDTMPQAVQNYLDASDGPVPEETQTIARAHFRVISKYNQDVDLYSKRFVIGVTICTALLNMSLPTEYGTLNLTCLGACLAVNTYWFGKSRDRRCPSTITNDASLAMEKGDEDRTLQLIAAGGVSGSSCHSEYLYDSKYLIELVDVAVRYKHKKVIRYLGMILEQDVFRTKCKRLLEHAKNKEMVTLLLNNDPYIVRDCLRHFIHQKNWKILALLVETGARLDEIVDWSYKGIREDLYPLDLVVKQFDDEQDNIITILHDVFTISIVESSECQTETNLTELLNKYRISIHKSNVPKLLEMVKQTSGGGGYKTKPAKRVST